MQENNTTAAAQKENIPQTPVHPHHLSSALFHHEPHQHKPRNVNVLHEAEKAAGGFNQKVAVGMTGIFQAMPTFWLIITWIVLWIIWNAVAVASLRFDPLPWPLLLALASVPQLPLMIVIMVGQGLLGRKQELQSDEQFRTTMSTYHDIEQIMQHLVAQDTELLRHAHMLTHLLEKNGITLQQLEAEIGHISHLEAYTETFAADVPAPPTTNNGEK